ncbi:MAG: PIG-L family deacetylase, partial [Proteobacteria bacterium]|nr:PIG-L family deacetylase [Pseudomonadota bacterium]
GCGGTIAKLVSDGAQVYLITATKGEKSRFNLSSDERGDLGEIRSAELKKAAEKLGIKEFFELNYPDGELKDVSKEELTEKIKAISSRLEADIMITFEPLGLNSHPDHMAISRAATRAFDELTDNVNSTLKRLYYLAIPRSWLGAAKIIVNFRRKLKYHGTPDAEITNIIDISLYGEKKKEAWRCYVSQFRDFKGIRKYVGKKFFDKEHFIIARSTEDDANKKSGDTLS